MQLAAFSHMLHVCCSIQLGTACSGKKEKKTIYFVFASDAAKPLETHTEIILQVFNHKNFFHHCVHVNPEARLFALL